MYNEIVGTFYYILGGHILLNDKLMSLLVELKIAGIDSDVATNVLNALENDNQISTIKKFVILNKPLTAKALLAKVKELTNKDIT